MAKDYNKIRLVNGLEDAVYQALADIAITGLEIKIKAYKNGQFISRQDRQNKKTIRLALLIGLSLIVVALVFNIKVYL